jgi:hypothetical protein
MHTTFGKMKIDATKIQKKPLKELIRFPLLV